MHSHSADLQESCLTWLSFNMLFFYSKVICSKAVWMSRKKEKEEDKGTETWKVNYTNLISLEQNIASIYSSGLKNLLNIELPQMWLINQSWNFIPSVFQINVNLFSDQWRHACFKYLSYSHLNFIQTNYLVGLWIHGIHWRQLTSQLNILLPRNSSKHSMTVASIF